jgi:hypothetical protein
MGRSEKAKSEEVRVKGEELKELSRLN